MRISQLLVESRVIVDCRESDRNKILHRLAEVMARDLPGASSQGIFELLLAREEIASTAIGNGIAIPHARLSLTAPGGKWLSIPIAALLHVEEGVDFGALDGQPVFLVMAVISALENREDHLGALSVCSHLLRNPVMCARLLAAREREVMFRVALGETLPVD